MSRVVEDSAVDKNAENADTPPVDAAGSQLVVDGPAAKRIALTPATALADVNLQVVMQFAGNNEGIFIANVCKSWKQSYTSAFNHRIRTHRAAVMMSVQRLHWIWSEWRRWPPNRPFILLRRDEERDASWYLGKYASRAVIDEASLDKSLAICGEYLTQGLAASGRVTLLADLWRWNGPDYYSFGVARIAVEAASFGQLQTFALAWSRLRESNFPYCGRIAAESCARKGYIHVLEFLSQTEWWTGDLAPTKLGVLASAHDQISVLRWLPAHGFAYDEQVARCAAIYGDVSTINFLFENDCPGMDGSFVACCALRERLDALQWCYDTLRVRVPEVWNAANLEECMLLVGNYGKKIAAKFLLEHGAVWPDIEQRFGTGLSCFEEAGDCEFEDFTIDCVWRPSILEWAMAEGCTYGTWSSATCARLTKEIEWNRPLEFGHFQTLAWAHAHDCPCACPRNVPEL